MTFGATGLFGGGSLQWRARLRGLFSGLSYALALTLFLAVSEALRGHPIELLSGMTTLNAWRNIAATAARFAVALLPAVPLLCLTVNLTPRGGVRRAAWLLLPIVSMALWSTFYLSDLFPYDFQLPAFFTEQLLVAALVAAACVYQNSARGAAGSLLRSQIASSTLAAELDRARLQLLRSQIEPHFLFNTLANVRTLAHIDRRAAVEMLDNLMRYLAAALPRLRQDDSTLAEEMQLLDAYLGIYQVRMGTRLSYALTLPPELADLRVPTMMLLTLVENALKHGVSPVVEGGFIHVSAKRSDSALILKVADSGRGIHASHAHGTGTGLANLRLRLMLQYGSAAVLSLVHAEPRGVVASISLPIRDQA
jgi:signal transduction histidine kinase